MHVKPGEVFRSMIGGLNKFTDLRHSKVKDKFVLYKVSCPLSLSSLLKLLLCSREVYGLWFMVIFLGHF